MFNSPVTLPLDFTESTGPYREIKSPNDHRPIARVQYATPGDLDRLTQGLEVSQRKFSTRTPLERAEILRKGAVALGQRSEELAQLIALEGGKPLRDARVEVARAVATLELCAEEGLRLGGEQIPLGRTQAGVNHLSFTLREAIGPVLAISAFNHPLNLLAHQVGSALAGGCVVVLKPAPSTPVCASEFVRAFRDAGLEKEALQLVHGEVPEIQKLVASDAFGYVSFIGSAKVGWELRKLLAPGTRLGLEHGGHAPALIRRDADFKKAVPQLLKGAFYHAGQVCISTQRIFVESSRFQEFLQQLKDGAAKLKVGSALDETTDVGPLIRAQEVVRVQRWVKEALAAGAKLVIGDEVLGEHSQFYSPTIISHVPRECLAMSEEIFGPVVCVNPYDDEDELLEYLNISKYVFEASVYTQDMNHALRLAKKMPAMTVVINNHTAYRVDSMPFGGHGKSGLGMGGVKYAMEEMTRLKQVIINVQ